MFIPLIHSEQGTTSTNDIIAMISPENEKVGLGKGLKARGNVEDWLGKVEEAMMSSLRRITKSALADFELKSKEEWIATNPSQVQWIMISSEKPVYETNIG